jgi:hypothetical protein
LPTQQSSWTLSHLLSVQDAGRLHVNVGWAHPRPVAADDAHSISGSFAVLGIGGTACAPGIVQTGLSSRYRSARHLRHSNRMLDRAGREPANADARMRLQVCLSRTGCRRIMRRPPPLAVATQTAMR